MEKNSFKQEVLKGKVLSRERGWVSDTFKVSVEVPQGALEKMPCFHQYSGEESFRYNVNNLLRHEEKTTFGMWLVSEPENDYEKLTILGHEVTPKMMYCFSGSIRFPKKEYPLIIGDDPKISGDLLFGIRKISLKFPVDYFDAKQSALEEHLCEKLSQAGLDNLMTILELADDGAEIDITVESPDQIEKLMKVLKEISKKEQAEAAAQSKKTETEVEINVSAPDDRILGALIDHATTYEGPGDIDQSRKNIMDGLRGDKGVEVLDELINSARSKMGVNTLLEAVRHHVIAQINAQKSPERS